MMTVAIKAARLAGDMINRATLDLERVKYTAKGPGDYVSEVDHAAEEAIIATIAEVYPKHAFLAEERGQQGESRHVWIIDPIDGTTNFLHGLPQFAVSIALQVDGVTEQGVIYAPATNDLYTSVRGLGAFCNNRRIRVSKRIRMAESLFATSFPIKTVADSGKFSELFFDLTRQTAGVRRMGSAVLDLAHVATGAFDGYFGVKLKPWDIAAGGLMVQEAGGLIADCYGEQDYMKSGMIIAGSPKIFGQLMPVAGPVLADILTKSA